MVKLEVKGDKVFEYYYDKKEEKRKINIHEHQPYLYVKDSLNVPESDKIIKIVESDRVNLYGDKVKKIVCRKNSDVRDLSKAIEETYEADLSIIDRFRIDNKTKIGKYSEETERIFYIDIETQDLDVHSLREIISIVIYDNFNDRYYTLVWREDLPKKQFITNNFNKWGIESHNYEFNNEKEMLEKFLEIWQALNPAIITGWNVDKFDMPYIVNRLEKNELNADLLSSTSKTGWYRNESLIRLPGREIFDLMKAYKKIHENIKDTYKLSEVAQDELGYGKTEESGDLAKDIWKADIERLMIYNVMDVKLTVDLNNKLNIFKFFFDLANKTNTPLEKAQSNSQMVDMYLLSMCKDMNIVLPTKRRDSSKSDIKGATVLQPGKGLKHNIGIFDLKSLYPSIIITFNLSPETSEAMIDFENYEINFKQDKKGLLPIALEGLFDERERLKKAGKNDQQRVVKEVMNSFYGVMLFPNFRLNNEYVGSSITKTGREILRFSKKIAEQEGYKVVYGDTDSIFVEGVKTEKEAKYIERTLNNSYYKFVKEFGLKEHRFVIEYEAFVQSALFTGVKKKYALKTNEGLKIRGFEIRRSNSPRLSRKIQLQVLTDILNGKNENYIKEYLDNYKQKILNNEYSLDDIGLPIGISKSFESYNTMPQHIRAAKYSNDYLGYELGKDDKILVLFISNKPLKYPDAENNKKLAIAIEINDKLPKGFEVDLDEHCNRCVENVIKPAFKAMGWEMFNTASLDDY